MQFYNFPWNKLHLDQKSWCVQLKATHDESGQALLTDAVYCGLNPNKQDVWAIAARFQKDEEPIKEYVVIGLQRVNNEPVNAGGYQWGIDLDNLRVVICPTYHVVVRIFGNPLELHWRWSESEGERLAVLNIEAATKAEQMAEIWQQARLIHEHLRPRGGGPKETPKEQRINAVLEWRRWEGKKPKWVVARDLGCDTRTLTRWEDQLIKDYEIPAKT